jgi:hypothetical protein
MKTSKEIEALRQFFPFTTNYKRKKERERSVKKRFSERRNVVFWKQTYA